MNLELQVPPSLSSIVAALYDSTDTAPSLSFMLTLQPYVNNYNYYSNYSSNMTMNGTASGGVNMTQSYLPTPDSNVITFRYQKVIPISIKLLDAVSAL
jgi:hypothetical protein